ncbi:DUF3857 domain-containing protein [Marinilabilia salmonicolor]|uniref:DUF3857 domain-containing protein n=2 Tax=Marinilabilia salmonicolor TaxID=989 RepID=UPI000299F4EE|nr:DUF3857 domain-containing protein [Marinilabilia salmonicolor]
MKHYLFIFFLVITQLTGAQNFSRKFCEISDAEMNLTRYDKAPDAGAVVLYDKGESCFIDEHYDYNIRFTRTKRIKIFDKSELNQAEISIPFYVDGQGKTETVESIEAYTYNKVNGKIIRTPVKESDIFEERINEWWRRKKFVFPDVQEGSVLEMRYVVESPFLFNLPDWNFQDKIPTIFSQYEVRIIPFYEYVFNLQGAGSFDMQTSRVSSEKRIWGDLTEHLGGTTGNGVEYNENIHTFCMRNVPAFKDESFITSINDYIIKLDFQLSKVYYPSGGDNEIMTTWPKLNKALLDHDKFGKYIKRCSRFAKRTLKNSIDLEGQTETQKIKSLIQYVKDNYSWNSYNAKFASKSPADFVKQKSGNSAEINLFLLALFKAADIDAKPVILSTRKNGKIHVDYPFDKDFNYVVVMAGREKPILVDATNVFLPFFKIPVRCINETGLVVEKDEVNWVELKDPVLSSKKYQITIRPNPETLKAATRISSFYDGYEAMLIKDEFEDDSTSIRDFLLTKDISQIHAVRTRNYEKPEDPYLIFVEGEMDIEKIGDKIVFSPFLELAMNENKLRQKTRDYPVDLIYAREESFTVTILIPEGFEVEDLPDNLNISDDLADIQLNYRENEKKKILVAGKYILKKAVYSPNEYSKVKRHFSTIVRRFNDDIVISSVL